jgi:hypothetical protein
VQIAYWVSLNKDCRDHTKLNAGAYEEYSLTILWKKKYLPMLLSGAKTATRRRTRPMVKEGRSYLIRTGFFTHLSQRIRVDRLYTQRLGDMGSGDAIREGASSLSDFIAEWEGLYGEWDSEQVVWVVEFHLETVK